jgi:hypothetical protein
MKTTVKSLKEKIEAMHLAGKKLQIALANRATHVHSTTNIVNKDGKQQTVQVGELVSVAKSAEVLGYETHLVVANEGKALEVRFVKQPPFVPYELAY